MVPLASLQGAVAEAGDSGAALPAEGMRPGGAAVVLGPRNGNLWLAVRRCQVFGHQYCLLAVHFCITIGYFMH